MNLSLKPSYRRSNYGWQRIRDAQSNPTCKPRRSSTSHPDEDKRGYKDELDVPGWQYRNSPDSPLAFVKRYNRFTEKCDQRDRASKPRRSSKRDGPRRSSRLGLPRVSRNGRRRSSKRDRSRSSRHSRRSRSSKPRRSRKSRSVRPARSLDRAHRFRDNHRGERHRKVPRIEVIYSESDESHEINSESDECPEVVIKLPKNRLKLTPPEDFDSTKHWIAFGVTALYAGTMLTAVGVAIGSIMAL